MTVVARISRDEWDWAPDDGIPSAKSIAAALLDEEWKQAQKLFAGSRESLRPIARPVRETASPLQATSSLRAVREATLSIVRGMIEDDADPVAAVAVVANLIAADARGQGQIALLSRLIDPARVA